MEVCIVQARDLGSRFHQIHVARNFLGSVVEVADSDPACCNPEVGCTEMLPVVDTHRNSVGSPEILESVGSVHQKEDSVGLAARFDSAVAEGSAGTPSTAGAVGPCTAGMDFHQHWNSCLRSTALLHPPNRTLPRLC